MHSSKAGDGAAAQTGAGAEASSRNEKVSEGLLVYCLATYGNPVQAGNACMLAVTSG